MIVLWSVGKICERLRCAVPDFRTVTATRKQLSERFMSKSHFGIFAQSVAVDLVRKFFRVAFVHSYLSVHVEGQYWNFFAATAQFSYAFEV